MRKLASVLGSSLFLVSTSAAAFETEMLQDSGDPSNRVNIVILGDGYRVEDQALLKEHALGIVAKLWGQAAFAAYRDFFNVKLVKTISADDGAVNGFNPPSQPTIFRSFFNCNGSDRLLCIGDSLQLQNVLQQDAPEYDSRFDIVLVTVNDLKYGGAGGGYATTSADPNAPWIAVHEIGHSFAGLADEYDDGYSRQSSEFSAPNATIFSQREQVKWSVWIEPSTPVPTPWSANDSFEDNRVGVFEGAVYSKIGHFRPWEKCLMRALGVPFCPVCSEALVWNVYDKADPIETRSPVDSNVTLNSGSSQEFSFSGPKPSPNTQAVSWFLDGQALASGVTSVILGAAELGGGTHTLELRTDDTAGLVRRDPNNVLESRSTWTIQVATDPGGTGGSGSGGSSSGGSSSGGSSSGGSSSGSEPCSDLCASPAVFTSSSYQSGGIGTNATCHQTSAILMGANCGNFAEGRTFRVNNTVVRCTGGNLTLPPKRNGGYCFQASAGDFPWAYFSTW